MLAASRLHYLYLAYFSRPESDRVLYRAIRRQRWHRFLEMGIGQGSRARRMIQLAARHQPKDRIRYVGVDLFEARGVPASGLSLKDAHRSFKTLGISVQFLPGDPFSVLARSANALAELDAVVISADQDAESLDRAWFYLPRMLHPRSVVFLEQANPAGSISLLALNRADVDARARKMPRRAA